MNDPLATITLDAFLVALAQLDSPLPSDLQGQINEMPDVPDTDKLRAIVKSYPPLNQLYKQARTIFQDDDSQKSKGPTPGKVNEKAESRTGEERNDVYRTVISQDNSPEAAKQEAEKPGILKQNLQLIKQSKA